MDGYFILSLLCFVGHSFQHEMTMWAPLLYYGLSGVSDAKQPLQTLPAFVTFQMFWWALPTSNVTLLSDTLISRRHHELLLYDLLKEVVLIVISRQEDCVSLQEAFLPMSIQVSALHNWCVFLPVCCYWLFHSFKLLTFLFFFLLLYLQKFSIQSAWFVKNLYSSSAACFVITFFFPVILHVIKHDCSMKLIFLKNDSHWTKVKSLF